MPLSCNTPAEGQVIGFVWAEHFLSTGDRWLTPVPKTPNDAVKKGFGVLNTLRVVTKGHQAVAYANDKR
jgi:hypothetical protein